MRKSLVFALTIQKEYIMAQAHPEEISQPLHDAYACLPTAIGCGQTMIR
ncbi:MAG: hypothetical protein ACK5NY_01455 [Burkholderiaceae bacterium]